jgi:hypothetical protein
MVVTVAGTPVVVTDAGVTGTALAVGVGRREVFVPLTSIEMGCDALTIIWRVAEGERLLPSWTQSFQTVCLIKYVPGVV